MGLNVVIPEDFKPGETTPPKKGKGPEAMYWVYPQGAPAKRYGDASAEETYEWAKSLFKEFPMKDGSRLGLMVAKGAIIDMCIGVAIFQHRNLFGGPEFWDTLEEWQRVSRLTKKDEKKND